ncbi:MAG: hypothetical protein QM811_24060 [Pirellulales bacterium]
MAKTKKSDLVTIDRRNTKDRRGDKALDAAKDKEAKAKSIAKNKAAHAAAEAELAAREPLAAGKMERREKVNRRRQIDPTTCEREYTTEEVEFMQALDLYKRTSGRMFPTCSEVLEVIRGLGYVKPCSA